VGSERPENDEIAHLYRQYGAALVLFASAMTGDRTRAQDSVHEVFLRLIEKGSMGKAFDGKAFLFSCVRNAVLNETKFRRRDIPFEADSHWFYPPERDYAAEARLRVALQTLPADQREVIVLHLWGGLTFAEISEILGINANTVGSRYRYALTKLRRSILEEESCARV
jgi:RNA polymerase sigma factor (sigma-70 family)